MIDDDITDADVEKATRRAAELEAKGLSRADAVELAVREHVFVKERTREDAFLAGIERLRREHRERRECEERAAHRARIEELARRSAPGNQPSLKGNMLELALRKAGK